MDILTDKKVKTRKAHRCHGCSREIIAGSIAHYQVTVDNGDFLSVYFCNVCIEYMSRIIFNNDDGIAEGELKEDDYDGWEAVRLEME
ncbi:MAG: hypothetical protein PHE87_10115, partial [Victivallaceae bacterium]|nr:hypothetical protein [Victivallaceae bacterium]